MAPACTGKDAATATVCATPRGRWARCPSSGRLSAGHTEFPTLTLIAPPGAPASIEAEIANTKDYSVFIDGVERTTYYFDYIQENNTARISAEFGTGVSDYGTPTNVRALGTSMGALVLWDKVEYVNRWPATHYEVRRVSGSPVTVADDVPSEMYLDTEAPAGEAPRYQVRAVNELGVPGYWSQSGSVRVSESSLILPEKGGTADYYVSLTARPSGEVTVTPRSSDSSIATVSPPVVFSPVNWESPQQITVTGEDDAIANPNSERIAIISHTVSAPGTSFDGMFAPPVTVRVTDDDSALEQSGLKVSPTDLEFPENGGGRYQVSLQAQPQGEVTIQVVSGDPSAVTVSPETLRFSPDNWETPKWVTVSGVDDDVAELTGSRIVRIIHQVRGGGLSQVAYEGPLVTVLDNDGVGLVLEPASVTVAERDDADTFPKENEATYDVSLSARPTGPVRLTLSSGDTSVATVSPATMDFDETNWNFPQPVTVTGVDNPIHDASDRRVTTINHRASGGGFSGITLASAQVAVTDDDANDISFAFSGPSFMEGGDPVEMTVDLGSKYDSGELRFCVTFPNRHLEDEQYDIRLKAGAADNAQVEMPEGQTVLRFGGSGAERVVVEFYAPEDSGHDYDDSPGSFTPDTLRIVGDVQSCAGGADDIRGAVGGVRISGLPYTLQRLDNDGPQRATWRTLTPWLSFGDGATEPYLCPYMNISHCAKFLNYSATNLTDTRYTGGPGRPVYEDDGSLTLLVNLNHPVNRDVTIPVSVNRSWTQGVWGQGQSAEPGDFSVSPRPVVIPAGETSAELVITINEDADSDNDWFDVSLDIDPTLNSYRRFLDDLDSVVVEIIEGTNPNPNSESESTSVGGGTSVIFEPDAALVATVRGYVAETEKGQAHVDRWTRVLIALGVETSTTLTPMTAAEAQDYADRWPSRWAPVADELRRKEAHGS